MSDVLDAPVQTSEPDLFGDTPAVQATPHTTCKLALTGRLKNKAHVTNRMRDHDGHYAPVLVLELSDVGAGHHDVVAHVPYTEATRAQAEAIARRLRVHQVISVTADLVDVRVLLTSATFTTKEQEG